MKHVLLLIEVIFFFLGPVFATIMDVVGCIGVVAVGIGGIVGDIGVMLARVGSIIGNIGVVVVGKKGYLCFSVSD